MKIIFSLILVLISSATFAGINNDFSLKKAEQVLFTKNTLESTDDTSKSLHFSAFGIAFNLVLERNIELMNRFSSEREDIKLYIGKIEGNTDSWARLTVIGKQFTGAIFNGEELFLIDISENIINALSDSKGMLDVNTVIYRASDVSTELSCANHDDHESQFSYSNLIKNAKQSMSNTINPSSTSEHDFETAAATAMQQINLRIIADTQYAASSTLDPQAQVISQMNIVNGIFSDQVGVQFGITEIEVLTDNGPLTSSNASDLLTQFRTFVGNDNPGLAHLFTGRNIDGGTIGIAFVNAICRTSGVGLTEAGGRGTFGALTAAHEFGHNFGAPHDNETGSICASTPNGFLMNPILNGMDQFSQCSLDQIANTVANAQCLIPVDNTPTEPASTCDFSINFANNDNDFEFSSTSSPLYSTGTILSDSLNTSLGGFDTATVTNIDGSWSRECLSDSSRSVTFELNAELSQSAEYEADEFSQIALRVNGNTTVLDTLTGDGNGGAVMTTGKQQYQINVQLNPGINTVELVCFNNQKTFTNETTECNFNSLESSDSTAELCFPIIDQNDNVSMVCL